MCPAEETRDQINARESKRARETDRDRSESSGEREIKALQRAVSAASRRLVSVSVLPPSLARVAPRSRILLALWVRQRPPFANSSYPAETPPQAKPVFFNLLLLLPGPAIVVISSVAWCPCAASPLSWDIALGQRFLFIFFVEPQGCLRKSVSPPAEPSVRPEQIQEGVVSGREALQHHPRCCFFGFLTGRFTLLFVSKSRQFSLTSIRLLGGLQSHLVPNSKPLLQRPRPAAGPSMAAESSAIGMNAGLVGKLVSIPSRRLTDSGSKPSGAAR